MSSIKSTTTNLAYMIEGELYGLTGTHNSYQSDYIESVLFTAIPSPIVSAALSSGGLQSAASAFSDEFGPSSAPTWYTKLPGDVQSALKTPTLYPGTKFSVASTTSSSSTSSSASTTSPSTTSTLTLPPSSKPALSPGAIAGIVIAAVAFLFLIALTTFLWGRLKGNGNRTSGRSASPSREAPPDPDSIRQGFQEPTAYHNASAGSAPPYAAAKTSGNFEIYSNPPRPAELESQGEKMTPVSSSVSPQPDLHMNFPSNP